MMGYQRSRTMKTRMARIFTNWLKGSLFLCVMAGMADGAPLDSHVVSVRSVSGQFIAYERMPMSFSVASIPASTTAFGATAFVLAPQLSPRAAKADSLTLEPALLVVSCERIKEALLKELGMTDVWGSRVELLIDGDLGPEAMPKLGAVRGRREWSYELDLPKTIRPQALERALVGALLVEMANRSAGAESAEVPLWLLEGMAAHLEANNPPTLLLQPGTESASDHITLEGQKTVRRWLRERAPLTFQQLSWPDALDTDADRAFFRACSQLFVEELLTLKDGAPDLRKFLGQLGRDRNWQTAFLTAYQADFTSLLEVEKWWSVACVDFQCADSGQLASTTEVWRRLQETLDVPVEVRLDAARLPAEARITLQEAISQWTTPDAEAVVTRAIVRLELQSYRSTDELRPMIDSYITALSHYLEEERALERNGFMLKNPAAQWAALRRDIGKQLDVLDARREEMRTMLLLSKNTKPGPAVNISNSSRRASTSP
jgi:hypothetical protein